LQRQNLWKLQYNANQSSELI